MEYKELDQDHQDNGDSGKDHKGDDDGSEVQSKLVIGL